VNQNDPLLIDLKNELPFQVKAGGGNLGAGRTMGKWGRVKLGLGWHQEVWRTPTVPDFHVDETLGDAFARLEMDTLDRPGFPRLGMVGKLEGRVASESLGSDDYAATVYTDWGFARSLGNHTVRMKGVYATNIDESTQSPYLYRLGGFLNLSGFAPNALLGTTKALGQAQYLYHVGSLVGIPLYGGLAGEWGGVWNHRSEISEASGIWSGSVFTALDTGIGPVYFAYSQSEAGRYVISFNVGQSF
jgi:NTE family protein